jgi:hypothetical protein
MDCPSDLFDYAETLRRKEYGMARAAAARPELLAAAQDFAHRIAVSKGSVTADDVAFRMAQVGMDYAELGNAAGSVFRGKFEWTGQVVPSERASTHGRAIKVWRIKP